MRTVIETLADNATRTQDTEILTAQVRNALGRAIVQQLYPGSAEMQVMSLDPQLERLLAQAVAGNGDGAAIEPGLADTLMRESAGAAQRQEELGLPPSRLYPPASEPCCRVSPPQRPQLKVLAHSEVPDTKPSRSPRSSEVEHERQEIRRPTARDALHKVKEILGPDAIILSNRGLPGGGVEIMAVAQREWPPWRRHRYRSRMSHRALRPRVPLQAVAARPSDDDYTVSLSSQRAPAAVPKAFVPPAARAAAEAPVARPAARPWLLGRCRASKSPQRLPRVPRPKSCRLA